MPRAESLDVLIERAASGTFSSNPIEIVSGDARCCRVTSVVDDSRAAAPGAIFVARPGVGGDGLGHVDAAIAAGAVAILAPIGATPDNSPNEISAGPVRLEAADPLEAGAALALSLADHPERRLRVIGVTGTNGKTTIATLARQLVAATIEPCGLVGTVEIHDGRHAVPARMTTPGRLELAALLAGMVDAGAGALAIEISSHALDQGRTADLDVDVAIFTNLTGDHLDYHGTMEAYAAAKASLFAGLDREAVAIVNLDDPSATTMLAGCDARRVGLRVVQAGAPPEKPSMSGPAVDVQVVATLEEVAADAMRMSLAIEPTPRVGERLAALTGLSGGVDVPLVGTHNAFNVAAAALAAVLLGGGPAEVRAAITRLVPPRGRLEPVHRSGDDIRVYVDYAHTDDAIRQVLRAVRPGMPTESALVAVVGAGGDRDRSKRPRMLRAALDGADRVVVTSDNPRTEDPESIIDEVCSGAKEEERPRIAREVDRDRAIAIAIEAASPGDVVVVAGKGHERMQIIGTTQRPFDDVAVARAHLDRRCGIRP